MKPIKVRPGQLCTIDDVVYRAHNRIDGCFMCALNSMLRCPNIVKQRGYIECDVTNIILLRV